MNKTLFFLFCVFSIFSQKDDFLKGFSFKINKNDSILTNIIRGDCFGECPVYIASISTNGVVRFKGFKFTNFIGDTTFTIPKKQLQVITNAFIAVDYFKLNESYISKTEFVKHSSGKVDTIYTVQSDGASSKTSFNFNNKFHSVYNYFGSPKKLDRLEDLIEIESKIKVLIYKN